MYTIFMYIYNIHSIHTYIIFFIYIYKYIITVDYNCHTITHWASQGEWLCDQSGWPHETMDQWPMELDASPCGQSTQRQGSHLGQTPGHCLLSQPEQGGQPEDSTCHKCHKTILFFKANIFSWILLGWGSQHLWEHPALSGRKPLTIITPRSHNTSHSSYWEYITIRRTTHLTCLKVPIIYTMCWCVSACLCTGCDGRSHTFLRQQRTACLVRFHCAFACIVYHC